MTDELEYLIVRSVGSKEVRDALERTLVRSLADTEVTVSRVAPEDIADFAKNAMKKDSIHSGSGDVGSPSVKRGRPPKSASSPAAGNSVEVGSPSPKRGRGRPSNSAKTPDSDDDVDEMVSSAVKKSEGSGSAKRRGRPPKAEGTKSAKRQKSSPKKATNSSGGIVTPSAKRGRGRPPKSGNTTLDSEDDDEDIDNSVIETSNAPGSAKKRGRPPKSEISSVATDSGDAGTALVKRGRGRPPKSAYITHDSDSDDDMVPSVADISNASRASD